MIKEKSISKDYAVEVIDLSVQFDAFFAVNEISFKVERGEIFGFLGANGAGKTTTIRVLCGLLSPSAGKVRVAGYENTENELKIKSKVGYMSQKFTLYNDLTVKENLNFIASLRDLDRTFYQKHQKELLSFIQFDQSMNTIIQDLPSGTKQKISLVAALLHDPEIIFLDEPTSGVSPKARAIFWDLIRALSKNGKTVFVTTHYMDEAEQCERLALMREGKIIALDTPDNLKEKTFAMPMFELSSKSPPDRETLLALKQESLFSFVEPYGLRFHVSIKNLQDWNNNLSRFEQQFQIRAIQPSLEDVFIKNIEIKMV